HRDSPDRDDRRIGNAVGPVCCRRRAGAGRRAPARQVRRRVAGLALLPLWRTDHPCRADKPGRVGAATDVRVAESEAQVGRKVMNIQVAPTLPKEKTAEEATAPDVTGLNLYAID